jgi:hypothetical protein
MLIEVPNATISVTTSSSNSMIGTTQSPDTHLSPRSSATSAITSQLEIVTQTPTGVVTELDKAQISSQVPSLIFPKFQTTKSTSFTSSNAQTLTLPESALSAFTSFFQSNLLYVIACGSLLIVFAISLCIWYRKRSRKRRSQTAASITTGNGTSKTNDTSNTLTEVSSSMSSQYSQTSTMNTSRYSTSTSTAVATELGIYPLSTLGFNYPH